MHLCQKLENTHQSFTSSEIFWAVSTVCSSFLFYLVNNTFEVDMKWWWSYWTLPVPTLTVNDNTSNIFSILIFWISGWFLVILQVKRSLWCRASVGKKNMNRPLCSSIFRCGTHCHTHIRWAVHFQLKKHNLLFIISWIHRPTPLDLWHLPCNIIVNAFSFVICFG